MVALGLFEFLVIVGCVVVALVVLAAIAVIILQRRSDKPRQ
jgi:hypothetical protein